VKEIQKRLARLGHRLPHRLTLSDKAQGLSKPDIHMWLKIFDQHLQIVLNARGIEIFWLVGAKDRRKRAGHGHITLRSLRRFTRQATGKGDQ